MSAIAKKDQAVEAALANTEHIKPAVTTEDNDELKEYSRALLEQAIEIGKGNEHYDKYSFVQLPYAKLQNGSKHQRAIAVDVAQSHGICSAILTSVIGCCRLHPSHW